jgi:hypothetical protein
VRYRHEAQQKKRCKMVELLVAEWAWEPPAPRLPADQIVALRIGFAEVALRERVKQAGGQWNPRQKVGELCYGHVVALNLEARIVEYEVTTSRDQD